MALAIEQRRVTALTRLQCLDVVGELPLQVLRGFRPRHKQLAPIRAINDPALFP